MGRYGLRLRERRRRRTLGHGSKRTSDACGRRWFAHRWLPMRTKLKQKQPSKPAFADSSGADRTRTDDFLLAKRSAVNAVLTCGYAGQRRAKGAQLSAQFGARNSHRGAPGILRVLPFRSRIALRRNDFRPSSLARRSLVLPRSSQRRVAENTTHDLRRSGAPRIALGSANALRLRLSWSWSRGWRLPRRPAGRGACSHPDIAGRSPDPRPRPPKRGRPR